VLLAFNKSLGGEGGVFLPLGADLNLVNQETKVTIYKDYILAETWKTNPED